MGRGILVLTGNLFPTIALVIFALRDLVDQVYGFGAISIAKEIPELSSMSPPDPTLKLQIKHWRR